MPSAGRQEGRACMSCEHGESRDYSGGAADKQEGTESKRKPIWYDMAITGELGFGRGGIGAPRMSVEEAQDNANEILAYRKKIEEGAIAVCIDGRPCLCGPDSKKLPLGPHTAGGAETALVAGVSVGYPKQGKELIQYLADKGHRLGAHRAAVRGEAVDANAHGTGCGACDNCEKICESFDTLKNNPDAKDTIRALLNGDFRQDVYDKLSLTQGKAKAHDAVEEENIETLSAKEDDLHGHSEHMLVLNYEQGWTIDRDEYVQKTGKQLFVVDMWYLKELASVMADDDQDVESKLYHAMVAFQVATYNTLCDGSHRPVIFRGATIEQSDLALAA